MQAFATASRLRLHWAMLEGERTVEELAELTEINRKFPIPAVAGARQARLVTARREGRRHAYYRLHDHHVPELLAAIRHHQRAPAPCSRRPSGAHDSGG